MKTAACQDRIRVFRFLELPPELQKIVVEKYFEDNEFVLYESVHQEGVDIATPYSRVVSKYSIVNMFLVSRAFRDQSLAAMLYCGRGSHTLRFRGPYLPESQQAEELILSRRLSIDQTVRTLRVDMRCCWGLQLLNARFKHITHILVVSSPHNVLYQATMELMNEHPLTETISGKLDDEIARCASREFQSFTRDLGLQARSRLEKASIRWAHRIRVKTFLSKAGKKSFRPLSWGEFTITTCMRRGRVTTVKKQIPRTGWTSYEGKTPEAQTFAEWVDAVRFGDTVKQTQLDSLWVNNI